MSKKTSKEILEELDKKDIRDIYLGIRDLKIMLVIVGGLIILAVSHAISDVVYSVTFFVTGILLVVMAVWRDYEISKQYDVLKISRELKK